jgi:hypothetical protein
MKLSGREEVSAGVAEAAGAFDCEALGVRVAFRTPSRAALEAIQFQYAAFQDGHPGAPVGAAAHAAPVRLDRQRIAVDILPFPAGKKAFAVGFDGELVFEAEGRGRLLHELDNQLVFALQSLRSDLYFVHAACVARGNAATVIMGESGAGKSTAAYALSRRGVDYLSDELAAIDLASRSVLPYPRALCLKNEPPRPLRLPPDALRTEWTLHVSAAALGARVRRAPARLKRLIFLSSPPRSRTGAVLRALSRSEAALRLYQSALNQLAHPAGGLDDTLRLVEHADCFECLRGGVDETVEALARAGAL